MAWVILSSVHGLSYPIRCSWFELSYPVFMAWVILSRVHGLSYPIQCSWLELSYPVFMVWVILSSVHGLSYPIQCSWLELSYPVLFLLHLIINYTSMATHQWYRIQFPLRFDLMWPWISKSVYGYFCFVYWEKHRHIQRNTQGGRECYQGGCFFLFKDIHNDDYIAQMNHIVRQRQHTQHSECTSHTNEDYTKTYKCDD